MVPRVANWLWGCASPGIVGDKTERGQTDHEANHIFLDLVCHEPADEHACHGEGKHGDQQSQIRLAAIGDHGDKIHANQNRQNDGRGLNR